MCDNKHILWIDIVRMIAVTCVVLNHAVDEIFISSLYGEEMLTTTMTVFMYTFFTLGRLGVPLFLFVTGILLLPRNYTYERISLFYKKNLGGLIKVSLIWIVLYNIFNSIFYSQTFSIRKLILELLFLKNCNMPHMWYMPVIIGLYISIPFISLVLHNAPKKYIFIVGVIIFLYQIILPTFIVFLNMFEIFPNYFNVLDMSFLGSCYGLYIICGYYINDNKIGRDKLIFYGATFIICIIISVYFQTISFQGEHISYNVWYDFMFLYIASFAFIKILSQLKIHNSFFNNVAAYISRSSLAIFFIHMPVRFVLSRYISFQKLPRPIALLAFFSCMYAVSIILVAILSKSIFFKKNLLMIKS